MKINYTLRLNWLHTSNTPFVFPGYMDLKSELFSPVLRSLCLSPSATDLGEQLKEMGSGTR